MPKKSLVLIINAHQPYIRHIKKPLPSKDQLLFSSISNTYLPLLNMFDDLESEGIPFKVTMVFSPVLCALLSDPILQKRYIDWQENVIRLCESEAERYPDGSSLKQSASICLEREKRNLLSFTETLNQDILSKFVYYAKKGNIELMATTATNCFLPHFADMPEVLNAQIETGLQSHRNYFGVVPEGFWLPYMGYTAGIERSIRSYGFNYTVLDKAGVLFGKPVPETGIFAPVRCSNSLAVFARSNYDFSSIQNNPVYLDLERDIGFEDTPEYLASFINEDNGRMATGCKYWSKKADVVYDPSLAAAQTEKDAASFLAEKSDLLGNAAKEIGDKDPCLVCCFDAEQFGGSWFEGVSWLNHVFRQSAQQDELVLSHCNELLENQFSLPKIMPFSSANSGAGYGEDLLDSSNGWMLRYSRKASERMVDLAVRFSGDTGLKARALNLAAKEILLSQSSDWAKMVHDKISPAYAAERFKESILGFTTVYDSLGSNSISTEWLTNLEREHTLFPWMNYRVFSSKH